MTSTVAAATTPQSFRMLGEYNGYNFPGDIQAFTQLVDAKPDLVMWFQSWDEPLYYSGQMTGVDSVGVTPLITWSPGSSFSLANLNGGTYDSYIQQSAQLAKDYGKPMMIRLFHEMNGSWQSFSPQANGGSTTAFVNGWRHVVDIFRANGANNVSWVWSPNIYGGASTMPFDSLYPGDSYVDWTGLDGYNTGSPWQSMATVFGGAYDDITALSSKPLMLAEWGSSETGGSKAAWITQSFFTDIPQRLPLVKAVVSFDRNYSGQPGEDDWRVNSSPSALAAYIEVVKSPLYGGASAVATAPTAGSSGSGSASASPAAPAKSNTKSADPPADKKTTATPLKNSDTGTATVAIRSTPSTGPKPTSNTQTIEFTAGALTITAGGAGWFWRRKIVALAGQLAALVKFHAPPSGGL